MFQILLLSFADISSAGEMDPFIVGGREVSIRHWPFIAFLEVSKYNKMMAGCGGSLISSQSVLTAAHCLDDHTKKKKSMRGLTLRIYMGHTSFAKATMTRKVLDYKTHKKYSPSDATVRFDIGIMFLERPVKFAAKIQKSVLQPSFSVIKDKHLMVAGWGNTKPIGRGILSRKLKEVNVTSTSRKCSNMYKVICTAVSKEYAYSGDSGGPLVNAATRHQLGLVSFRQVDSGITVFTSVPEYWNWIERSQRKMFLKYCWDRK